jgi:hypothetical protein
MNRVQRAVVGTAFVVLAAGCSATDDAGAGPTAPAEELSTYWADLREILAGTAEQSRDMEEAIAACMALEGFDYVPTPVDPASVVVDDGPRWADKEQAAQEGYGFVVAPEAAATPATDPSGADAAGAMGDAELEAYLRALHGANAQFDDGGEIVYDAEDAGCIGEAGKQLGDPRQALADLPLDALSADYAYLEESVRVDGAVQRATSAWSTCLASTGLADAGDPEQLLADLTAQYDALWAGDGAGGGAALAEFGAHERALAVADLSCREESGLDTTTAKVRESREATFVAEHASDLEAIRQALVQAVKDD